MKLNNNDDSHNSGLNLLIYNMLLDIESHPAWVCGLKRLLSVWCHADHPSHPAWVCGLKLTRWPLNSVLKVTPCVGVWIETSNAKKNCEIRMSHPAWVCGLKLTPVILSLMIAARHTLRGCVDWNLFCNSYLWQCTCHTLRGCVDWNLFHISSCQSRWSHTLRGCVDWNL